MIHPEADVTIALPGDGLTVEDIRSLATGRTGAHRNDTLDSGAYQLLMRLHRDARMTVGSLGPVTIPCGMHIYTGRAARFLSHRVARHVRAEKALRWHIDYLLREAVIVGIGILFNKASEECRINQETRAHTGGYFAVPGLGASDCRCSSHLVTVENRDGPRL